MGRTGESWTAQQTWHLSYISEFTSDIRHVSGKQNVVADALSRAYVGKLTVRNLPNIDMKVFREEQINDPELHALQTAVTSLKLEQFEVADTKEYIVCDVSTGNVRAYVPKSLRKKILFKKGFLIVAKYEPSRI